MLSVFLNNEDKPHAPLEEQGIPFHGFGFKQLDSDHFFSRLGNGPDRSSFLRRIMHKPGFLCTAPSVVGTSPSFNVSFSTYGTRRVYGPADNFLLHVPTSTTTTGSDSACAAVKDIHAKVCGLRVTKHSLDLVKRYTGLQTRDGTSLSDALLQGGVFSKHVRVTLDGSRPLIGKATFTSINPYPFLSV